MSGFKLTLKGMEDTQRQMERIERGARAMQNSSAVIGSGLPYAYGQEYGRHRVSNKLARKSGGVMYLHRAVETLQSGGEADLAEGLNKVTAPGVWVIRRLGLWARRIARVYAPRRKGKLRRSLQYQIRRRR